MPQTVITAALLVFLSALLTNNILLSRFLGMCSFVALSKNVRTAAGMGMAVTFVTTCTALLNYLVYHKILAKGAPLLAADLTYLRYLVFIMIIAAFVQLAEMVIERFSPVLHVSMGIFLPLMTVNCAILGITLFMIERERPLGLLEAAMYAFGSGLGWMVAICLMAGIRRRIEHADIPRPLRGLGITIIITGLMAMAFLAFATVDYGGRVAL